MAKFGKKRKILKMCLIIALSLILVLGAGLSCAYFALTANVKLDKSRLSATASAVSYLGNNGEEINSFSALNDDSVIPEHTKNAFIAKEDKRFYSHGGVDIIRMFGALKANITSGEVVQGGSTITQQLIKNTHLTQERTMGRKLKEIKLALELENTMTKDEILDSYLSSIYFGNGIFGIKSAAKYYFNKKVSELSIAESALLSGIISAPSVYNPVASISASKEKGEMVLKLMQQQNYITESEYESSLQELQSLIIAENEKIGTLYTTLASIEAAQILGLESLPTNSNIIIKTYLDPKVQRVAEEEIKMQDYKAFLEGGTMPGIASIVLDNKTGGIIAFAGDCKYNLIEMRRSPASTIKPILVYGPAIEEGLISPSSFVLDEPININGYAPQNATKKTYGYTTIRDNIVRSTNIPAVKVLNTLGLEKGKNFAQNLGITFAPEDNNLALALGGFTEGVTLLELADSYMALANGGNYLKSGFVKEIIINGISVYKRDTTKTKVMKDSTAYLLTDMLKSVAEYGTGRVINSLNIPVASKTGTNLIDGINHDGYNISYTTEHTALTWLGETGTPSSAASQLYNGGTYASFIIKNIFSELYDGFTPADFAQPESVVSIALDGEEYNKHNLVQADEYSSSIVYGLFATSNLPPKRSTPPSFMDTSFLEQGKEENFKLIYDRLIRKYGSW